MKPTFRGTPPPPRRTLLVALAAGAALVLPATSAFAHVTVNPREASQGSYAKLAFRVPNERDNAGTSKLEINFPVDHPFASVSVRPKAGWTYTLEEAQLATPVKVHDAEISKAVSKIIWTGGTVKPGEFEEFEVSVGPLPDNADALTFKALQTYSDGEVVRWIEEAAPGGPEVERPAPVLKLTKAAATATSATARESQGGEVAATEDVASKNDVSKNDVSKNDVSKNDVDSARTFGILGMVFGVLGLVAAAASRRRRPPAS